jgi:regulator of sigma E protease
MLLTLVSFFIVLGILVLVHEAGHYVTARRFGVGVEEFGLGIPPRAIGFYKDENGKWKIAGPKTKYDGKMIWSLNWIPLGGFVKIKGENGDSQEPDSFGNKSIFARSVILSAGVTMNIILAVVLLSVSLMIGSPQLLEDKNFPASADIRDVEVRVFAVLENSPAAEAGLQPADKIIAIDGQPLEDSTFAQDYLDQKVDQAVLFSIGREQETFDVTITPEILEETQRGGIGVSLGRIGLVSYPWYTAWWYGLVETFNMAVGVLVGFFVMIKSLLGFGQVVGEVYGPVGIASLVGDAARQGFLYILQFTAILSVIIAVINFLPFPALDGGRVFFLIIEAIRKKPVDPKIENAMHNVGFMLLMLLVVFITYRDIARMVTGG